MHAGQGRRTAGVDATRPGARVRRQHQRAEQHAGQVQVVDERPIAQRHLAAP
jgi:hypothetical protein